MLIVEHTLSFTSVVALTGEETLSTLRSLAQRNLGGGLVYDALLLACARKIDASVIYTHNIKHFRQIAPDLEDRIRIP